MNNNQNSLSNDAPIIKLVSQVLTKALHHRASDIHWEPIESGLRVRLRIDGVLHESEHFPKKIQGAILSRLKIMTGSMNIAEKRLPQDGRLQTSLAQQAVDFRVSTIPTLHGESIVMRLLDRSSFLIGLSQLGLRKEDEALLKKLLYQPEGLLLLTGPTGSGKTTTLYSCLQELNRPDRKIITVEDPVEYQIPGINQVQVNENIGMTFPIVLRSMLRQAVTTMMIGEIRDCETAQIAFHASLTGHLVFSTLHTNDAPGAIARLLDLDLPPFVLASALRAVIAQRLVRLLCIHCKAPTTLTEQELFAFQIETSRLLEATPKKAIGCSHCNGSGFQGRLALFEILLVTDNLRDHIYQKSSLSELREQGRCTGMRSLREDGLCKILAGLTTTTEVLAATAF